MDVNFGVTIDFSIITNGEDIRKREKAILTAFIGREVMVLIPIFYGQGIDVSDGAFKDVDSQKILVLRLF